MISKLVVWGDTRADAITRLGRVLDEYRVIGVHTTLPFFRWLIRQPEFLSAQFDTTYLDRVLANRHGQPFVPPTSADEEHGAIAAALSAWLAAHRATAANTSGAPATGKWRKAALVENLRAAIAARPNDWRRRS
jgi:acetyl/propionyl-CoA carboxylase alpha subunit